MEELLLELPEISPKQFRVKTLREVLEGNTQRKIWKKKPLEAFLEEIPEKFLQEFPIEFLNEIPREIYEQNLQSNTLIFQEEFLMEISR